MFAIVAAVLGAIGLVVWIHRQAIGDAIITVIRWIVMLLIVKVIALAVWTGLAH